MIKFFRKIRQQLLTENKFSKYLIYALGEIFLVVIGILIALEINNWNNRKITQNRLDVYIEQIYKDISIDLNTLSTLGKNLEEAQKSSLICWDYFQNGNIRDPRLFKNTFISIINNFDFDPKLQGIEGLRSSGSLEIIDSKLLEDLIYDYYGLIDEISIVELEYKYVIDGLEQEFRLHGFYSKYANIFLTEEAFEQVTYENISPYGVEILFLQTAHGTDVMGTGYKRLEEIGKKILKIISERKKNKG